MAHCTLFIVLVAALLMNTPYCSAESVYCVTPTATSCSSCPHNSINCSTLSEYAREAELHFMTNTTMVFLPGDHALDTNITVANVARLTMRGETSFDKLPTIVCRGQVGLSFTRMVNFKIYSLAFTSCSRKLVHLHATKYALLLYLTKYAELVNCSFHDNIGTALVAISTEITLAGNSEFTHNHCPLEKCIGGGIIALSSNLIFTGNAAFCENTAHISHGFGGAIFAAYNSVVSFNGTNNFISNSANNGGAICNENSVLTFNGISNFTNNSADSNGGAIYTVEKTILSFSGTSNFIGNSAGYGGAINEEKHTVIKFNGTNNFINNSVAVGGGAICALINTVLRFNGTNIFIKNSAGYGGALYAIDHAYLRFSGTNSFTNNSAGYSGGAVYTDNVDLGFHGANNFINNSAYYNGGAIMALHKGISFIGTSNFTNNSAHYGGAICTYTTLSLNGTYNFISNSAKKMGGGVYIEMNASFSILPNTTVYWENNHARLGGAIFVKDTNLCNPYVSKEECFFQLPGQNLSTTIDVQLIFKNNSADAAGSVLYGGTIDNCKLIDLDSYSSGEVFDMIVNIDNNDYIASPEISSDPIRICLCKDNHPVCTGELESKKMYSGETVSVHVVAFGQRNGTVPSTVRSNTYLGKMFSKLTDTTFGNLGSADLRGSQYLQNVNNNCTKLNYTVLSLSHYVGIALHAEGTQCSLYEIEKLPSIVFNLSQICPPGFKLSKTEKSCICEPRLAKYAPHCNITNGVRQITRQSSQHFWVGYDNQSHGLILHPHCPFDYCVNDTVVFSLNDTDLQCAYNRSGLLCGRCKEGYSLMLGSHQCRKCTNNHLLLLILFAVVGVALVFLLLACKLTVATGMLSGLLFYGNVIGPNRTIFLPVESTNPFSIFIAWINLDFGIETCFYNGLDTYSKTWLQFVFPVYIWLIVGIVVLASRYSRRFTNMLGKNPVSVLSTLILLSYTKILRTMITVFYVTYLEYPTYHRLVWLYNANIDYISSKHISLFLMAVLIFILLFLPYTILLLFGQWLQAISHLKLFSWVNSLKPFMDSYHAPYKAKYRYWPGLLLVFRFVLLLVFAFQLNPQEDRDSINLLAILTGTGILVVWAWISGGVYRNWGLDALEGSFALNLIILIGATFYVKFVQGDQLAVGYTSVFIAFATFIGILVFQLGTVTGIDQYLKRMCSVVAIRNGYVPEAEAEHPQNNSLPDRLINPGNYEQPFDTLQGPATAESMDVNEANRRLIPVYTYGSIN